MSSVDRPQKIADATNAADASTAEQLQQLLLRHIIQQILQLAFGIRDVSLRSWSRRVVQDLIDFSAVLFILFRFQILKSRDLESSSFS